MRRDDLPARLGLDPRGEELRQAHVLADQRAQPLGAVPAQHEPQLQRAEPAAERRPVVLQVDGGVGRGEVLGHERERLVQNLRPPRPERRAVHRREQPLVRVDDERVGALAAVEAPAELRADRRRAGVGRVDVQPDARLLTAARELGHGVDGRRRRRPDRRDDGGRVVEREVRAHPELVVDLDLAELEADEPRRLLDAEVRLLRRVDDTAGPQRPRCRERCDRRRRRRVLDVAVPAARQPEQLREPVQHRQLELGRGRRREPRHRVHVQRRDQELGEDPRLRAGVREPGEEARMVPVRERRQHELVEVAQHRRERLALLRRRVRQLRAEVARRDGRRDRAARRRGRGRPRPSRPRVRGRRGTTSRASSSASRSASTCACSARRPSSATRGAPGRRRARRSRARRSGGRRSRSRASGPPHAPRGRGRRSGRGGRAAS